MSLAAITWGRGMGHALLMGPSTGVPGTCFSSEFALDFPRGRLHPRSTQGAMLLLPVGTCSGQVAWLTCV